MSHTPEKIFKTDDEWRAALTPEQYAVLRGAGTEPPGSGEYVHTTDAGVYTCAACGAELFDSRTKFDSHSGWPSFFDAIKNGGAGADAAGAHVVTRPDTTHGMTRTEVLCVRCGGHLGHVFPDGPAPTGQRYCINSVALKMKK